jgi:hypothetical protein
VGYVDPKGHLTAPTRLRLKLYKAQHTTPVVFLKTKKEVENFAMLYFTEHYTDILKFYGV